MKTTRNSNVFAGRSNLVLIGMPGSGKSTVGKRLASHYGLTFIDADVQIERTANMSIQNIVNHWGLRRFAKLEQRVLCDLKPCQAVISTGGSAVYSEPAMHYLGQIGQRIYLKITPQSMLKRIDDMGTRGLFKHQAHSLMRLYTDRQSLYPKYADLTFNNDAPLTSIRSELLYNLIDDSDALPTQESLMQHFSGTEYQQAKGPMS